MAAVDHREANKKELRLRSQPGAYIPVVTFCCTNIFALTPEDRRFVLGILETLEQYEQEAPDADA